MESAIERLEHEIESVKTDICDNICKWPEQADNEYELLTEHCEDCPIGRL